MKNQTTIKLKQKAINYCIQNVANWKTLNASTKAYYIGTYTRLVKKSGQVTVEAFKAQLN